MSTPIILDANSLIVRCIMASALDDLKAGGVWTGGVYGTLGLLRAFLDMPDLEPGMIVAFFDHGVPKRRHACIPDYKGERKERRKLLSEEDKERAFEQLHLARQMMETLGVLCLAYRDREADDCLMAAVQVLWTRGQPPVVWSTDRDILQVVMHGARLWNGNEMIDADNFQEKVGVHPREYVLFKALVGDPSDSIQGAYGCGEKRAAEMIQEHLHDYNGAPPTVQLRGLVRALRAKPKLRKFEQSVLDDHGRLAKVIEGIDLRLHFGKTDGLVSRLTGPMPSVHKIPFLRICKRLAFRSVLGSPDKYLKPFQRAEKRRND